MMQDKSRRQGGVWVNRVGRNLRRVGGVLQDRAWLIGCLLVCLMTLLEPASLNDLREPFERAAPTRLQVLKQQITLKPVAVDNANEDHMLQHVGWDHSPAGDIHLVPADRGGLSYPGDSQPTQTRRAAWLTGTLEYVVE